MNESHAREPAPLSELVTTAFGASAWWVPDSDRAISSARALGDRPDEVTVREREVDPTQSGIRARRSAVEGSDDFELVRVLGRGAFATVFLAWQRSMERLVALKVSEQQGREHQTMARLDHPGIVRVFDQRRAPNGMRLLYMEYVEGGSLLDVMDSMRRMSDQRSGAHLVESVHAALRRRNDGAVLDEGARARMSAATWDEAVAEIGAQIAEALDYAHRHGVLHLDVKPANVLLTRELRPKLVDFNISSCDQVLGIEGQQFGGSVGYMAPEHVAAYASRQGRDVLRLDGRSDLYSLAITLWELLHGVRPFDEPKGSTPQQRLEQRKKWIAWWDRHEASRASRLERVLRQALSSEPGERFGSGRAFAKALRLAALGDPGGLFAAPRGMRQAVARAPVAFAIAFAAIPNAIAAAFNFAYNEREIIAHIEGSFDAFMRVQTVVNAIAFTFGLSLLAWRARPVARVVAPIVSGARTIRSIDPDEAARLRKRVLGLGNEAAIISSALWLLAGFAYPISLGLMVESFPLSGYAHFLVSLVLCGAMACAYPALFHALATVRVFYPILLLGNPDAVGARELHRVSRSSGTYLMIAGSIPMTALTMFVLMGADSPTALAFLGAFGALGFCVAFAVHRRIQEGIGDLLEARRAVAG